MLMLLGLSGVVSAQNARSLYLGYGNNDKLTSTPANPVTPMGKPGTKIVIERMRNGKLEFVSPKSKFKSGDKIRLRFATNFDGYIKIINVGSSGSVTVLFPYKGADDRLRRSDDFQVPKGGDWIVFDNTPGMEILTVIMSSQPFGFENDAELRNLNNNATQSRDLTVESDNDATYAVCTEMSLQKPIGFMLQLKHK